MIKALLIIIGLILFVLLICYVNRWVKIVVNHFYKSNHTKLISWLITFFYVVFTLNFHSTFSVVLIFGIFSFLITDVLLFIFNHFIKSKRFNSVFKKLSESTIIPIFITLIMLLSAFLSATTVVKTEYNFSTDKNLKNNKIKIAQISDLHYPTTMNVTKLKKIVDKINQEKVDILVLTGDIFDERTPYKDMKEASKLLGNVNTKSGVYYIFGNHDDNHYTKKKQYSEDALIKQLKKDKIKVLTDETVLVNDDFYIIGRYDKSMVSHDRKLISKLTEKLNQEKYLILLDHQPLELKEAAKSGVDLELGGHTHNGQIWPLGIVAKWFGMNENNYGVRKIGNYSSVVSSGTGTWRYPLRSEGKSEYVIININEA